MNRGEATKKAWRRRKREGGKGTCSYCHKAIYAGGLMKGGLAYHRSCYAFRVFGFTPKQVGIRNPTLVMPLLSTKQRTSLTNPRPPAEWWARMWARVAPGYPRERGESLARWRKAISQIVAGIWWRYAQTTRDKLVKRYG